MEYMSLYLDFVRIQFRAMREYPEAFLLRTLAKMIGNIALVCTTFLTIYRFGSLFSWSTYEVIMLYSMNMIAYALAGFFMFHPFTKLQMKIRDGTFDEILTKPLNPFFYLCSREFSTGYFANILVGITALVFSMIKLEIHMNVMRVLWLVIVLLGGGMIQSGFFILTNVPAFWFTKINALDRLRSTLESFIRYPISIYNKGIVLLLTCVFPYAFINFYPAQYFLNKDDYMMFSPVFAFLTPVVGFCLVSIGYGLFHLGIRYYNSTGS